MTSTCCRRNKGGSNRNVWLPGPRKAPVWVFGANVIFSGTWVMALQSCRRPQCNFL